MMDLTYENQFVGDCGLRFGFALFEIRNYHDIDAVAPSGKQVFTVANCLLLNLSGFAAFVQ